MVVLSIFYALAFIFLITTCYKDSMKKYHIPAKLLNSLGFIAIAIYASFAKTVNIYFFIILSGLILCLCGDVLLAFADCNDIKMNIKKYFIGGLSSFLIGHIVFICAFSQKVPLSFYDFIIPVIVLIITAFSMKLKYMNVENMSKYILIYSFFVAMLFSKGISLIMVNGISEANILLLIGSFLFLLSDTILLFIYFYEKKYYYTRFFNLLTYYIGMLLIALSLQY